MSSATIAAGELAGVTGSGKASVLWSCLPAGTVRQILERVDRAVLIDEAELRYQLDRKHDSPLARSPALLDVLGELQDRGLLVAERGGWRLTDAGRGRVAAADEGERFAVVEDDDVVVCAECVREAARESGVELVVHAWIAVGPGVCCAWCGAASQLDDDVSGGGAR
jgi:hypothetical protein